MEKEQICKEIFGYKKEKFVIFAENGNGFLAKIDVAPFVGAWIEISRKCITAYLPIVAPFVGAWIEIYFLYQMLWYKASLPSWERGLKLHTS